MNVNKLVAATMYSILRHRVVTKVTEVSGMCGAAHHIIVLNITAILGVVHKVEMSGENHPG